MQFARGDSVVARGLVGRPELNDCIGTVLAPQTPSDLARLVARAELFIGNDSGPGHLAAAVGTRTLSIFGPTDPDLWRPRGRNRCEMIRAPQGELEQLTTKTVFEAATAMLL